MKGLFLMLGSSERCGNLVWGSGLGDCVWRQWVGGVRTWHEGVGWGVKELLGSSG